MRTAVLQQELQAPAHFADNFKRFPHVVCRSGENTFYLPRIKTPFSTP